MKKSILILGAIVFLFSVLTGQSKIEPITKKGTWYLTTSMGGGVLSYKTNSSLLTTRDGKNGSVDETSISIGAMHIKDRNIFITGVGYASQRYSIINQRLAVDFLNSVFELFTGIEGTEQPYSRIKYENSYTVVPIGYGRVLKEGKRGMSFLYGQLSNEFLNKTDVTISFNSSIDEESKASWKRRIKDLQKNKSQHRLIVGYGTRWAKEGGRLGFGINVHYQKMVSCINKEFMNQPAGLGAQMSFSYALN